MNALWGAGSDWWKGYDAQWRKVLELISTVDNVWSIAGDLHAGTVHRLDREGPLSRYWEILVGPGGPHFGNPIPALAETQPELREDYIPSDQFLFADGNRKATFITFDSDRDTVHIRFLGADTGEVVFETTLTQEPT